MAGPLAWGLAEDLLGSEDGPASTSELGGDDDNAHVEALFRTAKYRYVSPAHATLATVLWSPRSRTRGL